MTLRWRVAAAIAVAGGAAAIALGPITAGRAQAAWVPDMMYGQYCTTANGQPGAYRWSNPDNSAYVNSLVCVPNGPYGSWAGSAS